MPSTGVHAMFPAVPARAGMYESFYLRAVAPDRPAGVWIRYTAHKQPGQPPRGALWCTVWESATRPYMHKLTTERLSVPAGGWIAVGDARIGPVDDARRGHVGDAGIGPTAGGEGPDDAPISGGAIRGVAEGACGGAIRGVAEGACGGAIRGVAEGACGEAHWSLRFVAATPELRHLPHPLLYRAPLPRTKLSSPMPAGRFEGTLELRGHHGGGRRTLALDGWRGMVGHNWGSQHAERWIWLHGIGFAEQPHAWIDVAIGRVRVAGLTTPWVANGALCIDGRRIRLGGLDARGLLVAEQPQRCVLSLPGAGGAVVEAHVQAPREALAGWRYTDPNGQPNGASLPSGTGADPGDLAARGDPRSATIAGHDVSNCSIAALTLVVHQPQRAARTLRTAHGAAYELGMREHSHGVPLAPCFGDG